MGSNGLAQKGIDMLTNAVGGLFGKENASEENYDKVEKNTKVALVPVGTGVELEQVKGEIATGNNTSDHTDNPSDNELEDAFRDLTQLPYCSRNTRQLLEKTSDGKILIPADDVYLARGVERGRKLFLTPEEAEQSRKHYMQEIENNKSVEPENIRYNIKTKDSNNDIEQTIPQAVTFIKGMKEKGCGFFDIWITGVSLHGKNVGIGHRVAGVVNKDGELRLFDRVVKNFNKESEGVTIEEYTKWMEERAKNGQSSKLGVLGIAAFK